jgi:hypothetical protein
MKKLAFTLAVVIVVLLTLATVLAYNQSLNQSQINSNENTPAIPTLSPTTSPTLTPSPTPTPLPTSSPFPTSTPTPAPPTSPQATGTTTLSQGVNDEEVYSVVQSADGSNALAGYTKSSGAGGSDMLLVKTEPRVMQGLPNNPTVNAVLWEKAYGGSLDDGAKSIVLCSDGGYLLAGFTKSCGSGALDMFLVKTDSNGNLLWNMTYGGAKDDGANNLIQASDSGYVLAGYTNSNVENQSTWIVKVDSLGNIQWNIVCSGQAATSITKTNDGGYALTVEQPNAFELVKLDSTGQVQWNLTYPAPGYSGRAQSVVQASDGGYAVTGWIMDQSGSNSTWLLKTDSTGILQWSKTYGGLGAYCIVQTNRGGYALTGDRAFVIVTDSAGNVLWNRNYDSLSDPNIAFTRGYALIQPATNQYVIAMVQASYGQILRGLQTYVVSISVPLTV